MHKIWHVLCPRTEAVTFKKSESYLLGDLGKFLREVEELELPLGTYLLVWVILGSLFYHEVTGTGKQHFGFLPLACYWLRLKWPPSTPAATRETTGPRKLCGDMALCISVLTRGHLDPNSLLAQDPALFTRVPAATTRQRFWHTTRLEASPSS